MGFSIATSHSVMAIPLMSVIVMHLLIVRAAPWFTAKAEPLVFVRVSVRLEVAEQMTGWC